MAGNFSYTNTLTNGTTADADEVMANFNDVLTNFTPAGLDDASADVAAMQVQRDPYTAATEQLATSLEDEIESIRYVIQQILHSSDATPASHWYKYPDLKTKTAAYTVVVTDKIILCDTTAGAFTLTLPSAVGLRDKEFIFKKIDSATNAVTIEGAGSETIDGNLNVLISASSQYGYVAVRSDGSNWYIFADSSDIGSSRVFNNVAEFNNLVKWAKGADIASTTTLVIGDDGNYFDVTGTTAITSIATKGIGTVVKLHFDAALTLTHHATDLILPGGANITTAAGDEAEFVEYASGDWRCTNYSRADGEAVIEKVITIAAGDYISYKDTTEYSTVTSANVKVMEAIIKGKGTLRIKFDLRAAGGATAHGQVRRNGTAVGTSQSTTSTTDVTFSEDIAGWSDGDLVQIYHWRTVTGTGYVNDFKVCGDVAFPTAQHISY